MHQRDSHRRRRRGVAGRRGLLFGLRPGIRITTDPGAHGQAAEHPAFPPGGGDGRQTRDLRQRLRHAGLSDRNRRGDQANHRRRFCGSALRTSSFFTVTPFPNTPLYDFVLKTHPEKLARVSYAGTDYRSDPGKTVARLPDSVLYSIPRKANRRFYMSPRRILPGSSATIRNPICCLITYRYT